MGKVALYLSYGTLQQFSAFLFVIFLAGQVCLLGSFMERLNAHCVAIMPPKSSKCAQPYESERRITRPTPC